MDLSTSAMRLKVFRLALLLAGTLAVFGRPADAGEVFVSSETGKDAGDGLTRESAFASLGKAVGAAAPGSIITLLPGWYGGGIKLKAGTKARPTVLRAERPGTVFLGRPGILSGFSRGEGMTYTYCCAAEGAPRALIETDTGKLLRYLASAVDVEELAGTYCFDENEKRLHIHPSDSAGVSHHIYRPVTEGTGITLANHTVVRGLIMTGFGNAAITGRGLTGAVVENCRLYGNGYAIHLSGGTECVIRGNEAWNNRPAYDEGAQIHFTGVPALENILVESNVAYGSAQIGIRFYSGKAVDCVARDNLTYGNRLGGFFYKVNDSTNLVGERNVSAGNRNYDFGSQVQSHNTYGSQARYGPAATDLRLGEKDWRFADPAYRDYRLQSDSPARGAAPDGSDLGALQYDGSVVYVRPDGNDGNDGTSVTRAWQTLTHACRALKPGQTLYLEPGDWGEAMKLAGIKAADGKPTRIRVRGRGVASVTGIEVRQCANLEIDGLRVAALVSLAASEAVTLGRCTVARSQTSGISIAASHGVVVEHCASASNVGVGVDIRDGSSRVQVVSCILTGNEGGQISVAADSRDIYSNFNAFAGEIGTVRGRSGGSLDAWQGLSGMDGNSLELAKSGLAELIREDFRVRAGHPLSFAGRCSRPIGPGGTFVSGRDEHRPIERVETVSTTRTSANITFWTPGRATGTVIEWGKTAEYGSLHDRGSGGHGEFETFHTVSLLGLAPGRTYHFRVGFRDHDAPVERKIRGKDPITWSADHTFTAATEDPAPRSLYVSLDGDDARDGLTPETPWRTLHKAAREARAGDTVTIAPGRYLELLRPLQTGTGSDRRITFRAERPQTVFLDGGLIKFVREGRSHCIQVQTKGFLTFENLTCEAVRAHDNGGYRGGVGYSGLIKISGSAGIEIKSCVMDGRARYMPCMWVFDAGIMPGVADDVPGFTVTDSVFAFGWRSLGIVAKRRCVFRNNVFIRAMTGMFTIIGGTKLDTLYLRNNIIQSLLLRKRNNVLWNVPKALNSDYNCFVWDSDNKKRVVCHEGAYRTSPKLSGLSEWRKAFGQDAHSIEAEPDYPLSKLAGFGLAGRFDKKQPIRIEALIVPADSPCRGRGENGEDIGPRWERFVQQ